MPQFTFDPQNTPGDADVMVAAGQQSPGVCKLMSGGDRAYNWDIKQAPGVQGYVMTYRGWKGGDPIVFRFTFFEDRDSGSGYNQVESQISQFYNNFVPIFAIDATKKYLSKNLADGSALAKMLAASNQGVINPVEVYHPILAANDITALVCQKISPLQTDGRMMWWVDMTFLEYRPPRLIKPATPSGATGALGVPTPQTKTQQQIVEAKALANKPSRQNFTE